LHGVSTAASTRGRRSFSSHSSMGVSYEMRGKRSRRRRRAPLAVPLSLCLSLLFVAGVWAEQFGHFAQQQQQTNHAPQQGFGAYQGQGRPHPQQAQHSQAREVSSVREAPPPLPEGWGEVRTPEGRVYYVHYPSRKTQWERPRANVGDSSAPSPTQPAVSSHMPGEGSHSSQFDLHSEGRSGQQQQQQQQQEVGGNPPGIDIGRQKDFLNEDGEAVEGGATGDDQAPEDVNVGDREGRDMNQAVGEGESSEEVPLPGLDYANQFIPGRSNGSGGPTEVASQPPQPQQTWGGQQGSPDIYAGSTGRLPMPPVPGSAPPPGGSIREHDQERQHHAQSEPQRGSSWAGAAAPGQIMSNSWTQQQADTQKNWAGAPAPPGYPQQVPTQRDQGPPPPREPPSGPPRPSMDGGRQQEGPMKGMEQWGGGSMAGHRMPQGLPGGPPPSQPSQRPPPYGASPYSYPPSQSAPAQQQQQPQRPQQDWGQQYQPPIQRQQLPPQQQQRGPPDWGSQYQPPPGAGMPPYSGPSGQEQPYGQPQRQGQYDQGGGMPSPGRQEPYGGPPSPGGAYGYGSGTMTPYIPGNQGGTSQLARGVWSRLAVGGSRGRQWFQTAKEKVTSGAAAAGSGIATYTYAAGSKVKDTVGSVSNKVATFLDGGEGGSDAYAQYPGGYGGTPSGYDGRQPQAPGQGQQQQWGGPGMPQQWGGTNPQAGAPPPQNYYGQGGPGPSYYQQQPSQQQYQQQQQQQRQPMPPPQQQQQQQQRPPPPGQYYQQ
jgi:hypothetical protein